LAPRDSGAGSPGLNSGGDAAAVLLEVVVVVAVALAAAAVEAIIREQLGV